MSALHNVDPRDRPSMAEVADDMTSPGGAAPERAGGEAGPHEIAWTLDGVSSWPHAEIICNAEPDDDCRTWCDEGCDEYCPGGHRRKRQDYCNVREWLTSEGVADAYEGPETPILNGPIEPVWDRDHYTWRYPAPAAGPDAAVTP